MNASKDGRVVVSADGDGAIRWHRADDGRELLTLQILPNKRDPTQWDWVLWTPEGFYEATPGAENVLKWVTNHGPNSAAGFLPVSAIVKLRRPNALPHVLDQLETAHALGVDDITQARFDVQAATGSAKPPGGVLHVLAIGVDKFGDKAGTLHLDYAAEDAHDVAAALLDSQKGGPGRASLAGNEESAIGGGEMAQVQRYRRAIAAAVLGLATLASAPAVAQGQGAKDATDLYDRPVLAIDPGMHTAKIWSQAVDAAGRFAVTGGDDPTVRIWSVADGKLLRTIWIPFGPEKVGDVYAVAITPDGSMIAVGGWTETIDGVRPIYIFERESGNLIRRIGGDLPDVTNFLTFSPDGRYLAATLYGKNGLRVFDRDKDWSEAFRDDHYGGDSYGAAFARDGRLATTSYDGLIRLYRYDSNTESPNFRRGERVKAHSGNLPYGLKFSPDGKLLAVGYDEIAAVDVLDGTSLKRVSAHRPAGVDTPTDGITNVAWSGDGRTLFAAGEVQDAQGRRPLFAWDRDGLGDEQRLTCCGPSSASGVNALPDGRILVAAMEPCLGLVDANGEPIWTAASPILDFSDQTDVMRVSPDGRLVDFDYFGSPGAMFRFDLRSLTLSSPPPNDDATLVPNRKGLRIDGWDGTRRPRLAGHSLSLRAGDFARSLAIAPDAKRFFLGSSFALTAFDNAGTAKWERLSRGEVWAVNASKDGRIVVAAHGDGAIRWRRADDGRELLALQVLPNKNEPAKWDWVLWTPEGFYEATPGAEDVLKWVVNHGPDHAATTLPVSAIAKLHRPSALPLVLNELETARALGVDDITQARLDVQAKTGSAKPPGGVLHVLAIGVDTFGDKAGGLHLDYAAEDAHDVATALLESQRGGPSRSSLYADVKATYLLNEKASRAAILDALDDMAQSMARSGPDQDTAVILVSSHGEMIGGEFYLIPYGVDIESQNRVLASALSATDFATKVQSLASHGKVLLLLDACHSGAVGPGRLASNPDAKVLRDAMNMENVTVLTSSKRDELSSELPDWKHGAFTEAFLDALKGAADSQGIVRLTALTDAMENELQSLTKGQHRQQQHLGMHANFSGDLFMAGHY
ncbi:MAG TPA: caspase family protein [Roseiarcus sp.]|nr:caspase family protein [Roseiarcus sp.]